jgi:hypothetical protein
LEYLAIFQTILDFNKKYPDARFSSYGETDTPDDNKLMSAISAAQDIAKTSVQQAAGGNGLK